MLINKNSYRIRQEFVSTLKDFLGFRITDTESEDYFNIEIIYFNSTITHFCSSAAYSRLPYHSDKSLVHQLFKELEKDNLNPKELADVAIIFKKYLFIAKQIDTERGYNQITPFVMCSFFLVLMSALWMLPENTPLIYAGLIGGLYALGFWSFSVWFLNKSEQALYQLKDKLLEKIYFLQAIPALNYVSPSPIYEEISEISVANTNFPDLYSPPVPSVAANSQLGYFYNSRGSLTSNDNLASSEKVRNYSI